jgi:hypothetical protein
MPSSLFQRARAVVFLFIGAARGASCGEERVLTAKKPAAEE